MTKLLSVNSKLARSSYRAYNFGIPAYKSVTGLITCPSAKDCIKGCYARQGAYVWDGVAQAYENRLQATLQDNFCENIWQEIVECGANLIRIHDSGDFYSYEYLCKWLKVIESLPHVQFYCYTKRIDLFADFSIKLPDNFTVTFSYGGKYDHVIIPAYDRHSRVFPDRASLKRAGYVDASFSDDVAAFSKSNKIGLIYHGAKSKTWLS